jgi:hypothetical protein
MAADLGRPRFEQWLRRDPEDRLPLVIAVLTILTAVPGVAAAGYCWRIGARTVRAGQYPPPGVRVVVDVGVMTGDAAMRRGRLLQACGLVLGVAAVSLALILWRLLAILQ